MAELVVGVIGDVLRHVAVEVRERGHVRRVAAVHSTELVVLLPEVALDELRRGEESQDRDITLGQRASVRRGVAGEHSAGRKCCGTGCADALQERAPADHPPPLGLNVAFLDG